MSYDAASAGRLGSNGAKDGRKGEPEAAEEARIINRPPNQALHPTPAGSDAPRPRLMPDVGPSE